MSGSAFRFLEKAKSREPKLKRLMIRFWVTHMPMTPQRHTRIEIPFFTQEGK